MEMGSTAGASAGGSKNKQEVAPYESKMNYTVSAKPLDFSFMKIQTVARKFLLSNPV